MRPSELYDATTLSEEEWPGSPAVVAMFGEDHAATGRAVPVSLPLRVLTKASAPDLGSVDGTVTWQVVTWEDEPIGVVVRTGGWGGRVVTDPAAHRRALLRLVEAMPPLAGSFVAGPDEDLSRLGSVGDQVLVRDDATFRAHPRVLCAGDVPLVDVAALAEGMDVTRLSLGGMSAPEVLSFREAVTSALNPDLRRTADHDEARIRTIKRSLDSGWVGPLVATDEATYLVCVRPESVSLPVGRALQVTRLGPPGLLDELATGPVDGPDVDATPPRS